MEQVILGLNSSLLSELEERMAQWSFDQCLGDIFKQFVRTILPSSFVLAFLTSGSTLITPARPLHARPLQTSFLKVYTSYINNFDNSITTLAKLKQSNANFSAYLSVHTITYTNSPFPRRRHAPRALDQPHVTDRVGRPIPIPHSQYAESRKECHGLQINSFLVMPVQRIPRYVLLLKVRTTSSSYSGVRRAAGGAASLTRACECNRTS